MSVKKIPVLVLLLLATPVINGQTVNKPNYAMKSHETLEIIVLKPIRKQQYFT